MRMGWCLVPDCSQSSPYVRNLRPIIDAVTLWEDEPADEITDATLPP